MMWIKPSGGSLKLHPGRRGVVALSGRIGAVAVLGLSFALVVTSGCQSGSQWTTGGGSALIRREPVDEEAERRIRGQAHYATAVLTEMRGDTGGALEHFVAAALADPAREDLVVSTAQRLLQHQRADEAVDFLEQCVTIPRAPASYYCYLGIAHALRAEWDEAIAANRAALDRDPTFLRAYQNLIAIHTERREPDRVLAVIREAARQPALEPSYFAAVAEMLAGYARLHPERAEGLRPETLAVLDRAMALEPTDAVLVEVLAGGYKRLGELEKAEELYRDFLSRVPRESSARQGLLELYLRTDNRKEAAELLRELLSQDPGNERAAFVLGSLALQEGNLDEAEEWLKRSVEAHPLFEPPYAELAVVYLSRDQPEEALKVLDQARERFPRGTFAREFYTGLAHARAERWEAATRHFTAAEIIALAEDPGRLTHVFYFQFGAASERRGDYEAAETLFRKCLKLSPDLAEALNYLGYMWAEQGKNLEEAREMIERAVALEPDNAAFLDSLGWVLFRLGRVEEALPWLEKAVDKVEEPDATLFDHLGDVLWALGREELAREAWRSAVAVQRDAAITEKIERSSERSPPI